MELITEMQKYRSVLTEARSVAGKVALAKEKNPTQFCPAKKCLYRTGGGYCPKHKTTVKEESLLEKNSSDFSNDITSSFNKVTPSKPCVECDKPNSGIERFKGKCLKCHKKSVVAAKDPEDDIKRVKYAKKSKGKIAYRKRKYNKMLKNMSPDEKEAYLQKQAGKRQDDEAAAPKGSPKNTGLKRGMWESNDPYAEVKSHVTSDSLGMAKVRLWQNNHYKISLITYKTPLAGNISAIVKIRGRDEKAAAPTKINFETEKEARTYLSKKYGIGGSQIKESEVKENKETFKMELITEMQKYRNAITNEAKNCGICGKPVTLSPSAAARAKKFGGTSKEYTNAFPNHADCELTNRKKGTTDLIKKHYNEAREELVDDWCSECYGEEPEMSKCPACKGCGTNEKRKVKPATEKDKKAWRKTNESEWDDEVNGGRNLTKDELTKMFPMDDDERKMRRSTSDRSYTNDELTKMFPMDDDERKMRRRAASPDRSYTKDELAKMFPMDDDERKMRRSTSDRSYTNDELTKMFPMDDDERKMRRRAASPDRSYTKDELAKMFPSNKKVNPSNASEWDDEVNGGRNLTKDELAKMFPMDDDERKMRRRAASPDRSYTNDELTKMFPMDDDERKMLRRAASPDRSYTKDELAKMFPSNKKVNPSNESRKPGPWSGRLRT